MTSQQLDDERIFHVAKELSRGDVRSEYLDQVCAGDQALRERVEALLEVHEQEQSFLKSARPGAAPTVEHALVTEAVGQEIGRYKLLQKIGEGGMGTVFMAEQSRPVSRRVALKIIKPGMDSSSVIARFEAERQALAMMDHPNIARVLDAGTTETGRPYFVMELVKGVPITEYCDDCKLPIRERLELFVQVCRAVQHAHQKGIIHRDIKPSNVLIAKYDDKPVPKIIDFGVAKAISQRLTEKTMFTQYGQIVGTLEYMSPEQAQFNQLDVDTRSDIYSLGVLLYELLTSETPFDGKRLRSSAFEEVLRILRDEEPPRPSARISTLGSSALSVSKSRQCEPNKLGSFLKGDLDWIVMKALAKDRGRRYQSASNFADDISNYLTNRPVDAGPPSAGYRMRKYASRHKGVLVIGATILVAMAIAIGGLGYGLRSASQTLAERNEAIEKKTLAEQRLLKRNVELNQALREWRHELIDRGLDAAMRGDLAEASRMARKAAEADAPQEMTLVVEGLAYLFRSDTKTAHSKFSQAFAISPNNLSVVSALTMSLDMETMNQDLWQNLMHKLETLPASEEYRDYDELLRGWNQIYGHADTAVHTLTNVLDRRESWPIARTILSIAQSHSALENQDTDPAQNAYQNASLASDVLGDTPLVLVARLWNLCVQLSLSGANRESRGDLINEAEELVSLLEGFDAGWASRMVRAFYFDLIGDRSREMQIMKRLTGGGTGQAGRIPFYVRMNIDWQTIDPLTDEDLETAPMAAVSKAVFLAYEGDKQKARHVVNSLDRPERSLSVRADALQVLLLLEEFDSLRAKAKRLLPCDGYDSNWWANEERLTYLAGSYGTESDLRLLDASKDSLVKLCRANYLIGLRALARKDMEKAVNYFERTVGTGQFVMLDYQMARAFLHLLKLGS